MQPSYSYRIRDQQLWLSPDRCVFWEEERALIVSDLHFGKTGHFRKSGIGVPQIVYREDLQRLLAQVQYFQPRQLLVVGDLFHSRENKELALFQKWRNDFPDLAIRLIRGNHDILKEGWYQDTGIEVIPAQLQIGCFLFVHDIGNVSVAGEPVEKEPADTEQGRITGSAQNAVAEELYAFSGHIHPGIRINGMGKQSLQLPCFHFGASYAVLPAFSRFTGTVSIEPERNDNVFAILQHADAGTGRVHSTRRQSIFQIQ